MINIVLWKTREESTQAEFLKKKYKLTHISTGDVFPLTKMTDLGKQARVYGCR
jgi:adenylate kinase